MITDNFILERWEILSKELKVAVAIKILGDQAYFSNIVKETGMKSVDAHIGQNRLVDLGKTNGYGDWKRIEDRFCLVPTITDEGFDKFLDILIVELRK